MFGATGIVLSIKVNVADNSFWDCNYWSSYQSENERVFLGGKGPLEFLTIRDVPLCINYSPYIKVLKIFDLMIEGYCLGGTVPKSKDVRCLSAVFDCVIKDNIQDSDQNLQNKPSSVPAYIASFFRHYLLQKELVLINLDDWTFHKGGPPSNTT